MTTVDQWHFLPPVRISPWSPSGHLLTPSQTLSSNICYQHSLSVMLGPVLACRLVREPSPPQSHILTLSTVQDPWSPRTRFRNCLALQRHQHCSKSVTQQGSPFTPPGHHSNKNTSRAYICCTRGITTTTTVSSNILLSTIGSIPPDSMDLDLEQDAIEMMELGSLSTVIGGQDGEPVSEEHGGRLAPDYSRERGG